MKKFSFLLLIFLIPFLVAGQGMLDPTKWSISYSKKELKVNETVDIIFSVTIDEGWHLYSLGDEPPQLSITIDGSGFKAVGKFKESVGVHKGFDEALGMDVKYFEKKAEFRQTVKVLNKNPKINIEVEGQACLTKGQCVRVTKSFTVNDLKIAEAAKVNKPSDSINTNTATASNKNPDSSKSVTQNSTETNSNNATTHPNPPGNY